MAGVITASEPSWKAPFTGLSPRQFSKLITALRREGADPVRKGRPWSLPLEDRVLLLAAYWRTNLTPRLLAPLFGVSKSAADRILDHLGPSLALQQRKRFRKDTVLIADGTLIPTRDHTIAEQSKNYRYSTNHQVVIDADPRLAVAVGRPVPGNRNDCKAWGPSGAKDAVGRTTVIADGGYRGTGLERGTQRHADTVLVEQFGGRAHEVDDDREEAGVDLVLGHIDGTHAFGLGDGLQVSVAPADSDGVGQLGCAGGLFAEWCRPR